MEPNSRSIALSVDLFLRELSAFVQDAGSFAIAVIGLPNHVFGMESALFLTLAILFMLGLAIGWIFCWYGSRLYERAFPLAERFLEERLDERLARAHALPNAQAALIAAILELPPAVVRGVPPEMKRPDSAAEPRPAARPAPPELNILDRAGPL